MTTMPRPPALHSRALAALGEQMSSCDVQLYAAQREADTTSLITLYLERASIWTRYSELAAAVGAEAPGAQYAARRDRESALKLQAEVEGR
jgi:hypothetical protein